MNVHRYFFRILLAMVLHALQWLLSMIFIEVAICNSLLTMTALDVLKQLGMPALYSISETVIIPTQLGLIITVAGWLAFWFVIISILSSIKRGIRLMTLDDPYPQAKQSD